MFKIKITRINTNLLNICLYRLGLIPLKADPRLFEYPSTNEKDENEVSDQDTLRYEMKVTCSWNPQPPKDSRRPNDIYRNNNGNYHLPIHIIFHNIS